MSQILMGFFFFNSLDHIIFPEHLQYSTNYSCNLLNKKNVIHVVAILVIGQISWDYIMKKSRSIHIILRHNYKYVLFILYEWTASMWNRKEYFLKSPSICPASEVLPVMHICHTAAARTSDEEFLITVHKLSV